MSPSGVNDRRLRGAHRSIFGARSAVTGVLARVGQVRVSPEFRGLRWLSAIAGVLFLLQMLTGVLLSLYYYPEPGAAYTSTRFITAEVTVGWLVRSAHHWSADLLVLVVLAHLAVVWFRRAYTRPREIVWFLGVILLGAIHAFRFTGSLLPWDTEAFAAASRGLELLGKVPVIGSVPAAWLRGGEVIGANTLSRFFITHVLILPWIVVTLIVVHLWLLRRHGLKGGAR